MSFKAGIFFLAFLTCRCFAGEFVTIDHAADVIPAPVLERLERASLRIEMMHVCTATLISDDGLFVTALHCIRDCIRTGGPSELWGETYESKTFENVPYTEIRPKFLHHGIICNVNDRSGDLQKKILRAEVLVLGAKGWIDDADAIEKNPGTYEKLVAQGFGGVDDKGDFAVLKVVKNSGPLTLLSTVDQKNAPHCLPLRATRIAPGEATYNLSYPFLRRNGETSSYSPLASDGKIVVPTVNVGGADFIVSTNDAEQGSSGSGLIDAQGRLAGVFFSTFSEPGAYTAGTTISIPSDRIFSAIQREHPELLSSILSCK